MYLVDLAHIELQEAQGGGGILSRQQLAQLLQHMAYAGVFGQAQLVLAQLLCFVTVECNLQRHQAVSVVQCELDMPTCAALTNSWV